MTTPHRPEPETSTIPQLFESDVTARLAREVDELACRRLSVLFGLGSLIFLLYLPLDLSVARKYGHELNLPVLLTIRIGFALVAAATAYALRRWQPRGTLLLLIDLFIFLSAAVLLMAIIGPLWGRAIDYYIGLIQLLMARALFVPGGLRRTLPVSVGIVAMFPLGLHLFAPGGLPLVLGPQRDLFVTASAALLGCLALCLGASYLTDRMQTRQVRAEELGRYTLKGLLGEGGEARVYKAWHNQLGRPCAIKVIPADQRPGATIRRRRFEQEARRTSQLAGQHIVRIYDYGETRDGDLYYTMELLHGTSLRELVHTAGPLPPARAIHLLRQACLGLQEAHGHRLIHQDIKPANLFVLDSREEPDFLKILDFGVASQLAPSGDWPPGREGAGRAPEVPGINDPHQLRGTPAYMAPEQGTGEPVDPRADLYALGGVAYFMLTGERVFPAPTPMAVLVRRMTEQPEPPSRRRPDLSIPADLERVVLRCLARDPHDRYPSAASLRRTLEACQDAGHWSLEDATQAWAVVRNPGAGPASAPETTLVDAGPDDRTVGRAT